MKRSGLNIGRAASAGAAEGTPWRRRHGWEPLCHRVAGVERCVTRQHEHAFFNLIDYFQSM